MIVDAFAEQSRWIDLDGPVHYLDFGGPASGPAIVCVHGLGGSAVNWAAIAPLLTGHCRVLALDLAGHGFTESNGRGTDVMRNRVLLHRFIEAVPGGPVILMGNSMGGMIALLEAAAAPDAVAGLILLDPAVPFVFARPDPFVAAMFAMYLAPGLRQLMAARRRRWSAEQMVAGMLGLCCVDPGRVPADIVSQHVAVLRRRASFADTERDFAAATRSVLAMSSYFSGAAYRRGIRQITSPVLLVHGSRDRLVPLGAARAVARANPAWSMVVLLDVGHVPQLEAPHDTARTITDWLGSAGRPAAEQAAPAPQQR